VKLPSACFFLDIGVKIYFKRLSSDFTALVIRAGTLRKNTKKQYDHNLDNKIEDSTIRQTSLDQNVTGYTDKDGCSSLSADETQMSVVLAPLAYYGNNKLITRFSAICH